MPPAVAALTREQREYLRDRRRLAEAAPLILGTLREVMAPASLIEVGCGDGSLLACAIESGIGDVAGIEAFRPPTADLRVPADLVRVADLAAPGAIQMGRRFDLVVCLNLVQTLSEEVTPAFLTMLTRGADAVLFCCPVPGQDGQPRSPGRFLPHWEQAFRRRGFDLHDFFRPRHLTNADAPGWARQGVVLFRRRRDADAATPASAEAEPRLGPVVLQSIYTGLHRQALATVESNRLIRMALTVPHRKLAAFDAALLDGEEELAARAAASIDEHHLRGERVERHVATLCAANDLLCAGFHYIQRAVEAEPKHRQIRNEASRFAEGIGRPDLAWEQLDAAGFLAPQQQTVPRCNLALRLGRRDWLKEVLARPDAGAELRRFAAYLALPEEPPAAAPPVYVVNLPTDRYRRRRAGANLAGFGAEARFRRGHRPAEIPPEGRALYGGKALDLLTDGSYGNQYSQYLVWREIAAGDDLMALVIEDDSLLLADPAAVIAAVTLPPRWDVVFANPRLDLSLSLDRAIEAFTLTPFVETFARHSHASPDQRGFGLDCILLSREGARKLVAIVETEGFHAVGTDWYVQAACVPEDAIGQFNAASRIHAELAGRIRRRRPGLPMLDAHVLSPSLTEVYAYGIDRTRRV